MAWVDIVEARAAADQPLDAGLAHAVQLRLERTYEQSVFDHNITSDGYDRDYEVTATEDWAASAVAFPILARPRVGGLPRQMFVEVEAKGSSATAWTLRAYLLSTRYTPPVDASGALLGEASYVDLTVQSSDYSWRTGTITTPGRAGALLGDGTIAGYALPVWWLHVLYQSSSGSLAGCKWRRWRLREVLP